VGEDAGFPVHIPGMSNLSAPTEEQTKNLAVWRATALEKMPYMASMIFSLRPVNFDGVESFAVDAQHRLYVNFDGIASWSVQLCAEALLHECGHLYGDHSERAKAHSVKDDEQTDWNYGADAEINDDLVQAGCSELAAMCITPKSLGMPDNDLAEVYFDGIKAKRAAKKQQQGQPQAGQGNGSGAQGQQGQPGQAQQGQPQAGQGAGQGQPGRGSGGSAAGQPGQGKFAGCGSGSGGQAAPGELGSGDANGAAPGASDAEHQRVRIQTSAAIAEHVAKGRGTVPGGLVETAAQVLAPPKVPWKQTLAAFMRLAVKRGGGGTHSTYAKANKRKRKVYLPNGSRVLFPGTFKPRVTLAVVRDTSGSMGGADLAEATNEIVGIAAAMQIKDDDLRILDVDAVVHTVKGFKGAETLEAVSGRGGTDMCVGIERAMQLDPTPTVIVVCTDGYTPWPAEQTDVPVVACLIGKNAEGLRASVPDWIVTVVVDRD